MNPLLTVILDDDDDDYLSNSSLSSSEDELDVVNAVVNVLPTTNNKRTAIKNYDKVTEKYNDQEFLGHFRMSREKVQEITGRFAGSDIYKNLYKNENSRLNISAEKHVLVFLWFAGHQTASYRDVGDRFDLCLSSLHDVIMRVMMFVSSLAGEVIKYPTQVQKQETMAHYFHKNSFPGIIGAIDGSHIRIDKPTERSVDYVNRKDFYSIVLQGVCDHTLNFTDIFVGYPGSVHDARVFRNSTLYDNMDILCGSSYILGDSAYPLSSQLLTPYRDNGHLTRAQKCFNQKLSSCRVSIEHTFGLLKQRFRQLYHIKLRGHEKICYFIRACCVLHNIANKDDVFHNEERCIDVQPETELTEEVTDTGANIIRDEICHQLYTRLRG